MTIIAQDVPISLNAGVRELGPFNVPNGLTELYVKLLYQSTATPTVWVNAGTVIDMEFHLSPDGVLPYERIAGMRTNGGIHIQDGIEQPFTDLLVGPIQATPGRKLKVVLNISGPRLSTVATVEAR